jgi:predicted nucleotidyltransferase
MDDTSLTRILGKNYALLRLFLQEPDKELYLESISKRLNMSKMTISRSLQSMVEAAVLQSTGNGYRKHYRLKDTHLISSLKTLINLDSDIVWSLTNKFSSKAKFIILFGSRAKGNSTPQSDWDFIIVSDKLDPITINKYISKLEMEQQTQINVMPYTQQEYEELKKANMPFYQEMKASAYVITGDINET